MTTRVGRYIDAERCRRGVSRGELARRLGARTPKQMNRLANRIVRLERTTVPDSGLLDDVVRVLGLDAVEVGRLAAADEHERSAEYRRWLDESARPVLFERVMPGVVLRVQIPDAYVQASHDALEAYAADLARRTGHKVCVRLSNRHSTWFAENGTLESRSDVGLGEFGAPFMKWA